ncbi:MAG: hypothetical protein H0U40_12315 [Chloroflexia bacterium]|nr:hypothetical protein [Chloroflexia bacterium]
MVDDRERTVSESGLSCGLVGREFAERKESLTRDLFAHVERVEELPDGFAYRFPAGEPWPAKVLEVITAERRCCPFFTFEMVFEPHGGPLWLRLRGPEGVKAFVGAELGIQDLSPAARR